VAAIKRRRKTRSVSRSSDKHQRLRALQCFDDVYSRIRDGWPLTELARYIQEDKKEYTDISRAGLVSVLTDFRSSMPPGELIKKRMPQAFISAKKEVEEGLDELKELESLYRIQLSRVNIDLKTEQQIKKLLPSMTSEIKEARQILESVANLKLELGLNERVPQKHEVNVEVDEVSEQELSKNFGNESVKKVLEDPESRHRVLGTVERFLHLARTSEDDAKEGSA
jgi:hypothetical protein